MIFHLGKVMIPGLQFNIQFNLSDPDLFMDAEKTDTISESNRRISKCTCTSVSFDSTMLRLED